MNDIKFFIGPMSKNIIDSIKEFSVKTGNRIGLLPSRRQIDKRGGYVNNWATKEFAAYSKPLNRRRGGIILKRDHAGPGQGYRSDDGYESLKEDCKYFDFIHIDPWKKYPKYKDGLQHTIDLLEFCYRENPNIQYEIGTEESIRPFESAELHQLLSDLSVRLDGKIFSKIKYLVIQSGTSLKNNINTGEYDPKRLSDMVEVATSWNLLSKEHNGDYLSPALIHEKMRLGLDSINIAPEFGLLETLSYLHSGIDINRFWKICYDSGRWKKWVNSGFDPVAQKEELIKVCGHYVLSDTAFLKIKPDIDSQIRNNIRAKLEELHEPFFKKNEIPRRR